MLQSFGVVSGESGLSLSFRQSETTQTADRFQKIRVNPGTGLRGVYSLSESLRMDKRKLIPILMLGLITSVSGCSAPGGMNFSWLPWAEKENTRQQASQPAATDTAPSRGRRTLSVDNDEKQDRNWRSSLIAGFNAVDVFPKSDRSNPAPEQQIPAAMDQSGPVTEAPEGSSKADRLAEFENPFEDPIVPTAVARRRRSTPESRLEDQFRRAGIGPANRSGSRVASQPSPETGSAGVPLPLISNTHDEQQAKGEPLIRQTVTPQNSNRFAPASHARTIEQGNRMLAPGRQPTASSYGMPKQHAAAPRTTQRSSALSRLISRNRTIEGSPFARPQPGADQPEPALRELLQRSGRGAEPATPQAPKSALDRFREVNGLTTDQPAQPERRLSV